MTYSVSNFDILPKDLNLDLVETVDKIAKVACHLSYLISIGSLSSISLNQETSTNSDGDEQKALDVYADESIYKKFVSNSDSFLMKEFQKADWKNKFIIMEKFKDERLKYFAEILIFEEQPDLLEKNKFMQIKAYLKKRIMSTNKEKWLTIYDAYKKIDDLRVKYDNNKANLFILEDVNKYIENLEKKFNS